jgi:hypothetical protein
MITVRSASGHNCLAVVASIAVVLITIIVTAALLLPDRTLAQAEEPDQAEPGPVRTSPAPPPPPALQLNPPTTPPEPGEFEASAGPPAGGSDLEVVRFRPQVSLRRGESPPVATAEKSASEVEFGSLKRPVEEVGGPREDYQAPDIAGLLSPLDWNLLVYEGFEGAFPGDWIIEDLGDDGGLYLDRTWGDTSYNYQLGWWSAWPAAGGVDALYPSGGYSDGLFAWMEYGPLDFSSMADTFVGFGLWYDTEPGFDKMYFCASIDFVNYNCVSWSGYSNGWTDQSYWLTSYAGYSQVWLAWVFESDGSRSGDWGYAGPYVDEVWVWGDQVGAPPVVPTPDPAGELIQNGSFETGDLMYWDSSSSSGVSTLKEGAVQPPALRSDVGHEPGSSGVGPLQGGLGIAEVEVVTTTYVDGQYSARLWRPNEGDDFLYQTFDVPADVTDLVLNYWFAVTTYETAPDMDFFCASLRPTTDFSAIWVDLGCVDSVDATGYWLEVVYTLTSAEVGQVAGETMALMFELYNTGGASTAGWVDYVSAYASGGGGGGYIDPNEPNDTYSEATPINCGDTISGTIGEAVGGYDIDWFELSNVPQGQIDIDVDADTQVPPSALDSVVGLWDDNLALVAWNDDDGTSFDSYVVYTNTVNGATFYISVESYWDYGSPDSFYDLTVQCAVTGGGPPPAGGEPSPPEDTWTVMLYLNAEDPGFESILTGYRTDIEAFIGSKSTFLNVAILYDGSGDGDTTRYLVQPNGSYTLGTNKWNLGERNMGHPDTLENFVSWAMDQYPAENYYLAVDDHGDGVYGISWDSTSDNDQLTPPELYSALKSATHNGARKIDIFDYEACLMGLAENAYDLREWVDYVVFFEQISWGINTYPVYLSDLAATDTPFELGGRVVDRYYAEAIAANNGRGYPHTISLIDTSGMENVGNAVSSFGNALQATGNKNAVNVARDNSQAFAADMDATNPMRAEYIDLWDLASEAGASGLATSQAAAVKSAVDAAVVHERHASGGASGYVWDHSGAHGLSIYYPPTTSSSAFDSYVTPSIYQMSRDGTWDEFLEWAVPSGTRRGMSASRSEIKLSDRDDAFVFKYVYLPAVLK